MQYTERFQDGALTLAGAARRANVPDYVLRFAIQQGHLPAERRGRRLAVPADLDRYMAERH